MKIAVIGGGAAGMMFSTQYKKANPNDEVFVFEKSQYVAWAGCPTPYYIADELSFNDVVLGTPEDFIKRGVNVKTLHKVTDIDFKNKTLNIEGNEINGIFEYDKLVIAVGAKSFVPNIKGYSENLENVFTLSHAEHAVKIKEYINENKDKIKKAVVVGAGFIGLETAEAFNRKGMEVTIVEKSDKIFPTVSESLKSGIYESIEKHGIALKLNSGVNEIVSENNIDVLLEGFSYDEEIIMQFPKISTTYNTIVLIYDFDYSKEGLKVSNNGSGTLEFIGIAEYDY